VQLGVPVIATGFSGSSEIVATQRIFHVRYELSPVLPADYFHWQSGAVWADADIEHASQMLRSLQQSGPQRKRPNPRNRSTGAAVTRNTLSDVYRRLLEDERDR